MLIRLDNAGFGYRSRVVVRVDAMELRQGSCVGIFGPNGSGKTTLLRGITGLHAPIEGSVSRLPIRIGYLPQHRSMELHWPMSGLDAAMLAGHAHRRYDASRLDAMLDVLEVKDLKGRAFAKLSGGQQQRLLLAGALAAEPQLLVLDEPTDGLDVRSRALLLHVLAEQTRRAGLCCAIVSHDVEDMLELCDVVAWLHPAEQSGEASQIEQVEPSALAARLAAVRHIA